MTETDGPTICSPGAKSKKRNLRSHPTGASRLREVSGIGLVYTVSFKANSHWSIEAFAASTERQPGLVLQRFRGLSPVRSTR
jgi:hypothetical protein